MSDRSDAESSGSVPVERCRGERRVGGRRNTAVCVVQRFLGSGVVCPTNDDVVGSVLRCRRPSWYTHVGRYTDRSCDKYDRRTTEVKTGPKVPHSTGTSDAEQLRRLKRRSVMRLACLTRSSALHVLLDLLTAVGEQGQRCSTRSALVKILLYT